MPPSGYSQSQVNLLSQFLRSCAAALEKEGEQLGEDLCTALTREVSDIGMFMSSSDLGDGQQGVLQLTKEFYEKVLFMRPDTSTEFWKAVDEALGEVNHDILEIHIDHAKLTRMVPRYKVA